MQDIHRCSVLDRLSAFAFSKKSPESAVVEILYQLFFKGRSSRFILKVKMVSLEVLEELEHRKFNPA
ncbi:hypothetical protein GQ55_9G396000 [Panicum hallii var. hallii]|uniref:Uncharacterized protein n=1 Tax=Panicum hallii var. hallii TaxID=1504633 RepID=A0A2T7C9R2_9POAL|nr:hypothetical protein GQ55_9G396000 [Panicum hallii var. hallii]